MTWVRSLTKSILRLGLGEVFARLASFVLTAYISRRYGLELLGALALAQTVAVYVTQGTDQGSRFIGASVIARNPGNSHFVVSEVTRKRLVAAIICVVLGVIYGVFGPMPQYSRLCVIGFVIAVLPYALSLDWLAWGLSHFGWMGSYRAGVGLLLTAGALLGFHFVADPRSALVGANLFSAVVGTLVLWIVWRVQWRRSIAPSADASVADELRWSPVLSLGSAVILSQVFHNADTLLLGAMTSIAEVGRYSAAYKLLLLPIGANYLIMQSLFPRLAAATDGKRTRKLVLWGIGAAVTGGALIALPLWLFAKPILSFVYGSDLGATLILRILVLAIPMDFAIALLQCAFTSRGFNRFLLVSSAVSAITNIVANLALIPRMGAMGAAKATFISYAVLLLVLLIGFLRLPVFDRGSRIETVLQGNISS